MSNINPNCMIRTGKTNARTRKAEFKVIPGAITKDDWDYDEGKHEIYLQARMPPKGEKMEVVSFGMSKKDAEFLAISILRRCYKDEHASVMRVVDLLAAPSTP